MSRVRMALVSASILPLSFFFVQACDTSAGNKSHVPESISAPIEKTEVETLLRKAVEYVRAGDFEGLCSVVALMDFSCRSEVYAAEQAGWHPNSEVPEIVGFDNIPSASPDESPVSILKLSGRRTDGQRYKSDFAAMRAGYSSPREIKVVTPIYWSGVSYRSH